MLKKGKKVLLLVLALALSLALLAGCSGGWTGAQVEYDASTHSGDAVSNGGFVVQKGDWIYFINGVQTSSADNTYGEVVKGSLMRITSTALDEGNYDSAEIVVPELFVASDYTAGVYIYGDYVYYATPNTTRNLDGEVESGYLNFRRARLDGSAMTDYYVRVSSSSTEYRFVEENGVVYLLYLDSTNSEIHSYNTQSGVNTVLAKGYSAAEFDDSDPENPVVYYTMPVTRPDTYSASSGSGTTETSYNQLFRVTASATTGPFADIEETEEYIEAYTDEDADANDEDRTMEYINLGTLVLDGIGKSRGVQPAFVTPFNKDFTSVDALKSMNGFTYSILRYANGQVILSIADGDETHAYALEDSGDIAADNWDSIAANPVFDGQDSGELSPIARSTTNIAASTFFYKDAAGNQYYIYVDSNGNIWRVQVGDSASAGYVADETILAYAQSGATIVSADPVDGDAPAFLYYSMTGTNGNSLYRIQYNGTKDSYNPASDEYNDNANFRPTQYLAIDYNNSWYSPEVLGGHLFFASAEDYSENYVYVMDNPATNDALEMLNEQYQAVNDMFTEMDTDFGDAANLARYYYYGGDVSDESVIMDENGEHFSQYQAEDIEVLKAFINCADTASTEYNSHGFDFSDLKGEDGKALTRDDFYKRLGQVSEDDAETIQDNLISNLVLSEAEEETGDAWTWQWAAIFVPVGVIVIAGAVVAVIFLRRKKK